LIEIAPSPAPLDRDEPAVSQVDPEFLTTQAEIMKAAKCLQKVITKLELAKNSQLPDPALLDKLKRQVTVAVLPKTHLIRINARDRDRDRAREDPAAS